VAAAAALPRKNPSGHAEEFPLEVLLAKTTRQPKVALRFLDRLGYRADAVANGLEVLSTSNAAATILC